jgi:hypothetical protein
VDVYWVRLWAGSFDKSDGLMSWDRDVHIASLMIS